MKFKTTAIALAVAGVVAAPMAAQADIGAYASARVGLQVVSTDNKLLAIGHGIDAMTIKSHGSRFGIKGENDMGNGLTSFGHYELGVSQGGVSTRNLHVGLRGDFGEVKLGGKTYAAFYNHVTGPVDQPWWENGFGFLSTGRTGNVINYEGGSGAFGFGVAYSADGSDVAGQDEGQGYQVAGSFDIGPVKLGLGITSSDKRDLVGGGGDIVGGTISGDAGSVYYALTYQTNDDTDAIEAYVGFGNFYLNYGQKEATAAGGTTPNAITLGYTQSIGRGTSAWYEYATYDADSGSSADDWDVFHAVLKVDWK